MKSIWGIFVFILLIGCSESSTGIEETTDSTEDLEWMLIWEDDFDDSTLNSEKWEMQIGDGCDIQLCGWGNNELQWYQAKNVSLQEGNLVITAREEEVSNKAFTSARLRTMNKGDWVYGKIEVRAKLPEGQGIWPAIWMLPTDNTYGGWAASGEIDIVELVGHEPQKIYGSIHYGGEWPNNTHSTDEYSSVEGKLTDDFHIFSIEWEEGEIRWYIDGEEYARKSSWNSEGHSFPAPFNQRFHLLLNIAVGGNWPGNPDETTVFPQQMLIDYVRVYEPSS